MIGVRPEFQGQGVGRKLLAEVELIGRSIPGCRGVALDTETEHNTRVYQRCGYQIVGETALDDLPIWVMFLPF